ncbi:UNVERIFIED_CONTAM: calmodulin-binding carboxy-terminal kinesin-like family protein, putative [Hammondia hammondi]|eukprot:XP_008884190.1 calmodulin-binding carboxy-terminal kinesin-like family protein, putative [Hammondia hammondi]
MGDLLIMIRLVLRDNTREQVALFLQQLSARVVSDYYERRAGSLEHENQALKDMCGPEMQTRMEMYEQEIADLQSACEAARSSAAETTPAGDVQKLQNELTVLRAENMILRRKAAREDAAGEIAQLEYDTQKDGADADPLIIQDLSRTVEELEKQVEALKNENELLQTQLVASEEETVKGGGMAAAADIGAAKATGGAAAKMVQQLQQKNKTLESQVEPMKKRIRELEMAQKRAGGGDEQRVKELEMKLKDAEAENRKQQKQFELELSKSSKGSGMELKKLENQVQKLTERAVNAETALEATDKQLKETSKERDGLKKEAEDMKKQMGAAQLIAAEVETLRGETKAQKAKLTELEESYKQEKFLRKKYYNEIEDMKGKIRVYCRVRPMAKYEIEKECKQSVFPVDEYSVKVLTSKGDKEFMYDRTFPPECTQEEVYEDTKRLIQSVIDGFNVCIFAYGQTGSGKTFTIQGGAGNPGIAPRAINDLFDTLDGFEKGKFQYEAEVYMCELYNNQLIDLLLPEDKKKTPPALDIKKDATGMVMIPGITLKKVADKETLAKTFAWGLDARHVSGTAMNAESSRSHLIFSVIVRVEDLVAGKRASGKLSLIDLAGSERVSKSGVTKERLVEAKEINKSLSALGDVISALSSGETFIPYRNHKLTQVMSDSLGGTAKTLMFVNISPADYNTDETVTSLMYASRVKLITNDASKQVESKQLAALKDKVKYLTKAVEKLKKGEDISELEKKFAEEEPADPPEPEGPPSTEKDEDFEEPPDLPAD